jgi:hypothetical protein
MGITVEELMKLARSLNGNINKIPEIGSGDLSTTECHFCEDKENCFMIMEFCPKNFIIKGEINDGSIIYF